MHFGIKSVAEAVAERRNVVQEKYTGRCASSRRFEQKIGEMAFFVVGGAQVNSAVSLDRTCIVNIKFSHHFFCSQKNLTYDKSIFHTPMVEEVSGPRDICQC